MSLKNRLGYLGKTYGARLEINTNDTETGENVDKERIREPPPVNVQNSVLIPSYA